MNVLACAALAGFATLITTDPVLDVARISVGSGDTEETAEVDRGQWSDGRIVTLRAPLRFAHAPGEFVRPA
jgi:hypothetical protein